MFVLDINMQYMFFFLQNILRNAIPFTFPSVDKKQYDKFLFFSIKTLKYKTAGRGSSGDYQHQLFRSEQLLCQSPEDHPRSETKGKAYNS